MYVYGVCLNLENTYVIDYSIPLCLSFYIKGC